jgi:hypothetical protein
MMYRLVCDQHEGKVVWHHIRTIRAVTNSFEIAGQFMQVEPTPATEECMMYVRTFYDFSSEAVPE